MPRGVDSKLTYKQVKQAHDEHMTGWSLRAIARLRWQEWGYKSPKSALMGLCKAMDVLELPKRDRIEATVMASEVHGKARRGMRNTAEGRRHRNQQRRRKLREKELAALEWVASDQSGPRPHHNTLKALERKGYVESRPARKYWLPRIYTVIEEPIPWAAEERLAA